MRQKNDKSFISPRLPKGIGRVVKAFAVGLTAGLVAGLFAHQAGAQTTNAGQAAPNAQTAQPASENSPMTPDEILALFEREARAAYAMNQKACQAMAAEDKKICMARARLQFDADMRYAKKRAAQGY